MYNFVLPFLVFCLPSFFPLGQFFVLYISFSVLVFIYLFKTFCRIFFLVEVFVRGVRIYIIIMDLGTMYSLKMVIFLTLYFICFDEFC